MAFSATLTGTTQNITANGTVNITTTSTAGWVIGATIQGAGIPAGTKIVSFVVNASAVLSAAATAGTIAVLVSSKYGTTLTVALSASGDTATHQNIVNAGFGLLQGSRMVYHPGALTLQWGSIVAGAEFDHQDWTTEIGVGGRWLFDSGLLAGGHLGGLVRNGARYIRTAGPKFIANYWNNSGAGGSNMFINTGAALTQGGTFRMFMPQFTMRSGNNTAFAFMSVRDLMAVEQLMLDYSGEGGANASIGCGYGVIDVAYLSKANSGVNRTNSTSSGQINGFKYVGLYTGNPQHKLSMPDGSVIDAYAPQALPGEFLGGFGSNATETYTNADLSTAGYGLRDLTTKYLRYGGNNVLKWQRRVTLTFKDTSANDLAGGTLFLKSGSTVVVNEVQATASYNKNTNGIVLNWPNIVNTYRVAENYVDTTIAAGRWRKYGFEEQAIAYDIDKLTYTLPLFAPPTASLASISEAVAAAITTAGINWTTKTITPTADLPYDQINGRIAWELAQTANSDQVDPRTVVGEKLTLATGWTLVVNAGRTISAGTAITFLKVPTIIINGSGKIAGLYETSVGPSVTVQLKNVSPAGVAAIWHPTTSATELFQSNASGSAADYTVYYPPGSVGLVKKYARELYGSQRVEGSITLAAGLNVVEFVDVQDVGIANASLSAVQSYTDIDFPSKDYDRTAAFRLTEQGIKLGQILTRSGTSLEHGGFSKVIQDDASAVFSVLGNVITIKASSYEADAKYNKLIATPPATITAHDNEIITISIEDANGDSQATVAGTTNSLVDVWKITNSTPVADWATGTKIASDIGNGAFRWIGLDGFKLVFYNKDNGVYRYCSMSKGDYTVGWYLYDVPTGGLTQEQSTVLNAINVKNAEIFSDVNSITAGFVEATDSLHAIRAAVDAVPAATATGVWTATERTLTSTSSGGATLAEIEASTVLAKVNTAMTLDAAYDAAKTAAQQSSLSALGDDVVTLGGVVMDLPTLEEIEATAVLAKATDVTAVPAAVRTELAAELAHLDADVSSRSTLTAGDIPAGLTAEQVWTNPDRTLTETQGLTSGQAEQLRKVAQLHGIGAELVVTETARTAGDVSQTITTTEEQTTVSAA